MNISNYYWYFSGVLTPKFCDDVIEYALHRKKYGIEPVDMIKKNYHKEDVKNIQKKRKSDLVWLNDLWIYKEIHPYVHEANKKAGWNFDWERSEPCQFTKYKLTNIMIGIVIVGINLINETILIIQNMEELESYL